MHICKHCSKEFDITDKPKGWMANHSRWCDLNPKRAHYKNNSHNAIKAMNAARKKTGRTNHHTAGTHKGYSEETLYKMGSAFRGKTHTNESKIKMSKAALKSKHRRLRKNVIMYKGIMLDSSWELALAIRLDEMNIKWIRPEPITWTDKENNIRNYFADFYLPDYNLYLDPKNPYAIKVQKEKLDILLNQYDNIIIIDTLEKCKTISAVSSVGIEYGVSTPGVVGSSPTRRA